MSSPDSTASPTADVSGLLSAAVEHLGGAHREGQEKMAHAVSSALFRQRHLAVQAGTGTGKSLAYLVPAFRYAHETDTTVIVSTATIALQRQLVGRDLPALVEGLRPQLERDPTFAILKGRNNYLCLHKLDAEDPSLPMDEAEEQPTELSELGQQVRRITEWANETETGDRDDLDIGVSDRVWNLMSVSSKDCMGAATCPFGEDCFAEQARHHASDVDVVVTNHALLAIDALSDVDILPEHDAVIIDEAHELDGRITAVSTNSLSSTALKLTATRAGKVGVDGKEQKLTELAEEWDRTLEAEDAGRWLEISEEASGMLLSVRKQCRSMLSSLDGGELGEDQETAAERRSLGNHVSELVHAIDRIMEVFDTDNPAQQQDVVWLDRPYASSPEAAGFSSSSRRDSLNVAPLSVAPLLAQKLFATSTVVLTSATLALGGNFNAMAASWGLKQGSWDSLDAGTPFNTRSSGILYCATHLPAPGRDGISPQTLEEMRELIMAAGGRTLGLFSSRRAAREAAEKLRPVLPFDILLQGDDSIGALVSEFAKHENTCLFGTLTLWQGVDVPGRSLSLVMIDRLPFPRPDDPLLQARKEAADAEHRNGFMEVAATHAALLLAQGAGRLLRSVTDRGVVAVLDQRLVTKRYGSFLRRSLPPMWETADPAVVRGALQRLVRS
ncbi:MULTISPECIES: ATP-dependent DNA helicase [Corynebacterium]|uniref:ATP-dependent DNA helicase n=1 Tax=Corynebacterium TaxID=1716 RepID=UPI00124E54C9|nr:MULTISPECIES: ATP-dependent DNA helicase [Corynebacterium]